MRSITRPLSIYLLMIVILMGLFRLERAAAVPLADIIFVDANLQTCVTNAAANNGWIDTNEVSTLVCTGVGRVMIIFGVRG